jgi:hypothetical protein
MKNTDGTYNMYMGKYVEPGYLTIIVAHDESFWSIYEKKCHEDHSPESQITNRFYDTWCQPTYSQRVWSLTTDECTGVLLFVFYFDCNGNMSNDAGENKQSSAGGGGGTGGGGGGPRKESIMELAKMMDSTVRVKVTGGREFVGTLKGYDDLVNLVLDEGIEYVRGTW